MPPASSTSAFSNVSSFQESTPPHSTTTGGRAAPRGLRT